MKSKSVSLAALLLGVFFICGNLWAYSGGNGSEGSPYQISNALDWQELMATPDDWGSYFSLTADINLSGVAVTPVGNSSYMFYGVFDGKGHKISGAVIDRPDDRYVGLFGHVGSFATISNLGADHILVTGDYYVGGLVGYSYRSIFANCYATGTVNGYSLVGGLVGYSNDDSLSDCYAQVAVTGDSQVGGLVGGNGDASITNCYSAGLVVGYYATGGLVGWGWNAYHTTTACFWDTQTSGRLHSSGGTGKTTEEMKALATFTDAGWDFTDTDGDAADWKMLPDDYPRLQWEFFGQVGGQGSETNPYLIASVEDFLLFADKANAGRYWAAGVYTRLEADLDLQGISLTPIGGNYDDGQGNYEDLYFEGNFDGNGHRIFNATLGQEGQGYIGLFGLVGTNGVISKLGVENVTAIGEYDVGGLVGSNSGTIRFCYTTGQITGFQSAGGLVGYSYDGTITSCYSRCSVSGTWSTGGLVGHSVDNLIAFCYSTGLVSSSYFKGGLIGYNDGGTVSSCFWDMNTSNQPTSMSGEGRTTAQMKKIGRAHV